MPVKFNQYWRICHDAREDYNSFVLKKFIPGVNKLGIHTVAGWSVLVGGYSEIIIEGVTSDLDTLEAALKNPMYKDLNKELMNHVKNYKTKVLVQNRGKDTYSMEFTEETVKYSQMWDIRCNRDEGYEDFINNSYLPHMEELGLHIAGLWEVLIGDGPRIVLEGRSDDAGALIKALKGEAFRKYKRELAWYVENYESRLLVFHIQKIKGYKAASYQIPL